MATTKKKSGLVKVYSNAKKPRTKKTQARVDAFKRDRRIRQGKLLPAAGGSFLDNVLEAVGIKPKATRKKSTTAKKTTTRKKSTTTTMAKKSVISPICRRAGRKLKTTRSASAGATLGSKTCKGGAKKTTAKKTTTRKVVSKSPTAKRTARVSACAKKITAIRRILKSK
jgi:hypothetical protein